MDLEAIGNWIAEDNPERAITFIDELLDRCRSLADHPLRFPVLARDYGKEVRKLTHRNFLILYVVAADAVEIVHIVHGARDLTTVMRGE